MTILATSTLITSIFTMIVALFSKFETKKGPAAWQVAGVFGSFFGIVWSSLYILVGFFQ